MNTLIPKDIAIRADSLLSALRYGRVAHSVSRNDLDEAEALSVALRRAYETRRPEVITLCGSTRFRDEFIAETRRLTLEGAIVISVGLFGHLEGLDMSSETKRQLDELHKRKIDLSDRVHVVNPGGYIGASTRGEIEYAQRHGKLITYMTGETQ